VTCPDVVYTVFRSYCSSVVWKFTQQQLSIKAKAGTTHWMKRDTNCKYQQAQAAVVQEYICYVWNTDWLQIINWIHVCINTQIKCFLVVNTLFTVTQRQKEHLNG